MEDRELNHLIAMINQIADNLVTGDTVHSAEKVADHINRFWARSMKQQIIHYAEHDGRLLHPVARQAVGGICVKHPVQP